MEQLFTHIDICSSIINKSTQQKYINEIAESYKEYPNITNNFSKLSKQAITLFIKSIQMQFDNGWKVNQIINFYDECTDLVRFIIDHHNFKVPLQ